jgi:hypothetical protein
MSDMINKKKKEFDYEHYDSIRLLFSAESGALMMKTHWNSTVKDEFLGGL